MRIDINYLKLPQDGETIKETLINVARINQDKKWREQKDKILIYTRYCQPEYRITKNNPILTNQK